MDLFLHKKNIKNILWLHWYKNKYNSVGFIFIYSLSFFFFSFQLKKKLKSEHCPGPLKVLEALGALYLRETPPILATPITEPSSASLLLPWAGQRVLAPTKAHALFPCLSTQQPEASRSGTGSRD